MLISPPNGHLSGLHTGRGTGKVRSSEVSQRDLQRFLGFTNFYRRFVQNYNQVVAPLTCLVHKSSISLVLRKSCIHQTKTKSSSPPLQSWSNQTSPNCSDRRLRCRSLEPFFPKGPDHRVSYKHVPFSLIVSPQLSRTMMWETESCLLSTFHFLAQEHRPGSCNVKTNALSCQILPDNDQPQPANILPTTCQVGAFTWGIKAIRQTLQEEPNPGKGHPANRRYVPTAACLAVIPWSHTARFSCHPRVEPFPS